MAKAVKLSDNIVLEAKIVSKAFNRSVAGQIEYWAKIGKIGEENPDLTYEFIKDILVSLQEVEAGKLEAYDFDWELMMNVIQTFTFKRQIKKLHKNKKKELDKAIKTVLDNPYVGNMKKGDLGEVQVYKFKMVNQLMLLAYKLYEEKLQLILLSLGPHENFYRDLKR